MEQVTRIDWTVQTGQQWWSGTDDTVQIEILRDNDLIIRLNLEPGHTPRLDRGELATYFWVFQNPSGVGVSVSEPLSRLAFRSLTASPATCGCGSSPRVTTPGRRSRSTAGSPPASCTSSRARSTRPCGSSSTRDFLFSQDVVLSTDGSEGHTTWTLGY